MFRLLGILIRAVLALILVVLGIVFLVPYLTQCMDKWAGRAEEYPSFSEQIDSMKRVWGLLEEKEVGEVSFDDLMGIIGSDTSEEGQGLERIRALNIDELGLSSSELEELGSVYRDLLGADSKAATDVVDSAEQPEEGIRPSSGLAPTEGL